MDHFDGERVAFPLFLVYETAADRETDWRNLQHLL